MQVGHASHDLLLKYQTPSSGIQSVTSSLSHTHTHPTCALPSLQYLADIQEHLGVTIPEVSNTFDVPVDEYEGKVTYGEKRGAEAAPYEGHIDQLASSVAQLAKMEQLAQTTFLRMQSGKQKWFL